MNMRMALKDQIPVRLEEIDRIMHRHLTALRELAQERAALTLHQQVQQALEGIE